MEIRRGINLADGFAMKLLGDYGTMGAVMVLMLWFCLTGLAFLIGGEIDAIIERTANGTVKRGRRPFG